MEYQSSYSDPKTYIKIYFVRVPERDDRLWRALRDLVGGAGEVCGYRAGAGGDLEVEGLGWGYEIFIRHLSGIDRWADRLVAEVAACFQSGVISERPRIEIVRIGELGGREVVRRIGLDGIQGTAPS